MFKLLASFILAIEHRACNAVTSSDHTKEAAMDVTSWKPLSVQLLQPA